jgi:Ca-activated chloride channel family protein
MRTALSLLTLAVLLSACSYETHSTLNGSPSHNLPQTSLASASAIPHYVDQGRDRFPEIDENPVKVTKETPVSTFSIDVDTASYAFMRKSLTDGVLPTKDAIRLEELINYFPYDYLGPEADGPPLKANIAILPTPWNEHTKLLRIGLKGYDIEPRDRPRANLVFLVDTSGSMQAPDKLPLLTESLKLLVDSLDSEDSVAIVAYAGSAGTVLRPTFAAQSGKIKASLERLSAGGSTAGAEGLRQAYKLAEENYDPDAVNRVILATDGDFNVGFTDVDELQSFVERKRETGIFLSVLGFGRGNYNDRLMQALAQNGNGQAAYIDTKNEAVKVMVEEASSTLFPIAKDVKIQIEFNPLTVAEYRLIGYETRRLEREDFNNDAVDAGEVGSGHTVTALYELALVGSEGRMIDDLRYQTKSPSASTPRPAAEYAFLKIRYKRPDGEQSALLTVPVTPQMEEGLSEKTLREARFAAAVAAFGQILRGGRYTGAYSRDDVIALAEGAMGPDPHGYRAEFAELVQLADHAAALEPQ